MLSRLLLAPRTSFSLIPKRHKGVWSNFIENIKKEANKDKEFQSSVKSVNEKIEKIQANPALQTTKQVIDKAKEGVKKGNEILSKSASQVGQKISVAYGDGKKKKKKRRVLRSEEKKQVQEEEGVYDKVDNVLDGAYKYGGIRSKAYRERRKAEKMKEHEAIKEAQPKIEENPDAGQNVTLHKDSAWKVKWSNFKDNNKVFQSVFGMKKAYDESNNMFVHFTREITSTIADKFRSLFEETETAKTVKKICERDPSFSQEKFLKESRDFIIPEVLEALLARDLSTLHSWCSEGLFNMLKAKFDAEKGEKILESKILDLRHVELVSAKLLDDHPVMVLSFNAQHLLVVEAEEDGVKSNEKNEVLCEDRIENLYHVWALVKDVEEENPITGGWKVMEMATRNVW